MIGGNETLSLDGVVDVERAGIFPELCCCCKCAGDIGGKDPDFPLLPADVEEDFERGVVARHPLWGVVTFPDDGSMDRCSKPADTVKLPSRW